MSFKHYKECLLRKIIISNELEYDKKDKQFSIVVLKIVSFFRKKMIVFALNNATRVFSVAHALKLGAIKLGVDKNKIEVLGNGVDTSLFYRIDKNAAREKLGLPKNIKIIISVGHLVERKGFHLIVEALRKIKNDYDDWW